MPLSVLTPTGLITFSGLMLIIFPFSSSDRYKDEPVSYEYRSNITSPPFIIINSFSFNISYTTPITSDSIVFSAKASPKVCKIGS